MWSNDRFSSMRTTILLIERSGLLAMAILLAGGIKLHAIRSPPRTITPANAQCTPDGGLKKLSATLKGKEDPHPSYAPNETVDALSEASIVAQNVAYSDHGCNLF